MTQVVYSKDAIKGGTREERAKQIKQILSEATKKTGGGGTIKVSPSPEEKSIEPIKESPTQINNKSDSLKVVTATKTEGVREAIVDYVKKRDAQIVVSQKFYNKYMDEVENTKSISPEKAKEILNAQSQFWNEEYKKKYNENLLNENVKKELDKRTALVQNDFALTYVQHKKEFETERYEIARKKLAELPNKIKSYGVGLQQEFKKYPDGKLPISKAYIIPELVGIGIVTGGLNILSMAVHPVETIKGIGWTVTHIPEAGTKLLTEVRENPLIFGGELISYWGTGKLLQKALQPKVVGSQDSAQIVRINGDKVSSVGMRGDITVYTENLFGDIKYKNVGINMQGYEMFIPKTETSFDLLKGTLNIKGDVISNINFASITKFKSVGSEWDFNKYSIGTSADVVTGAEEVYTSIGYGYTLPNFARVAGTFKQGNSVKSLIAQETTKLIQVGNKEGYIQKGASITKEGLKTSEVDNIISIKTPTVSESQIFSGGVVMDIPKTNLVGTSKIVVAPETPKFINVMAENAVNAYLTKAYNPVTYSVIGLGINQEIQPEFKIEVINNQIPEQKPNFVFEQIPNVIPQQIPEQTPIFEPTLINKQTPQQIPQQIPQIIPEIIPEVIPETIPKVTPKITPLVMPETPVKMIYPTLNKKKKKKAVELFVRKKGKFKKVADYESSEQAVLMGKKLIEISAKASFKVIGLEGMNPIGSFLSRKSFYHSRKEDNVFIQRREKRISSLGEKREITFMGLSKLRNQKISGGKSIWAR
jgi:hypothetical protein